MKMGSHRGKGRIGEFLYLAESCPINTLVTKLHKPRVVHLVEYRVYLDVATPSLRIAPSWQIAERGDPAIFRGFIIPE
jgi:hypothetical protein